MHLFYLNILISKFLFVLHVTNLRVRLQEDGFIYRYGVMCFKCISKISHAGIRVCCGHVCRSVYEYTPTYMTTYTDICGTLNHNRLYNLLPED
jgi:hypothetical protein